MRRRRSVLVSGTAAVVIAVLVGASSPQVNAGTSDHPAQPVTLLALAPGPVPEAPAPAPPPSAPPQPVAAFDGLDARARQAAADARQAGADLGFTVLDRQTGQEISGGDGRAYPIASVSKLFIADDLLLQVANGKRRLSPQEHAALKLMLRSSDDSAAEVFWSESGGSEIVTRVAARYGLGSTTTPYDGHWWNTMSTTADLVRYYNKLLNGSGGLPAAQANIILSNLAQSTPTGTDGYPQRFGIPDALSAEPVAVKQGWMCCWGGGNWLHMSTGVVGTSHRFVIAMGSLQPVDDATARATMTRAVKTLFPTGRI